MSHLDQETGWKEVFESEKFEDDKNDRITLRLTGIRDASLIRYRQSGDKLVVEVNFGAVSESSGHPLLLVATDDGSEEQTTYSVFVDIQYEVPPPDEETNTEEGGDREEKE